MRYAGTALLCVVAAFGAAFLIRRAVDHRAMPRATVAALTRTRPVSGTTTTAKRTSSRTIHRTNGHRSSTGSTLAVDFTPSLGKVKRRRPKPKPKPHHHRAPSSAGTSSPTDTSPVDTTPTYTAPVPTETTPSTGSGSSSGGSSGGGHGSGSGTGTTSIGGGSGKGSGTTTIGG